MFGHCQRARPVGRPTQRSSSGAAQPSGSRRLHPYQRSRWRPGASGTASTGGGAAGAGAPQVRSANAHAKLRPPRSGEGTAAACPCLARAEEPGAGARMTGVSGAAASGRDTGVMTDGARARGEAMNGSSAAWHAPC